MSDQSATVPIKRQCQILQEQTGKQAESVTASALTFTSDGNVRQAPRTLPLASQGKITWLYHYPKQVPTPSWPGKAA